MNKNERLLNLIFLLLNTRNGVSRNRIRSNISDYREATSDASFERMFERDKRELKNIGFEITTYQDDPYIDDSAVYRINTTNSFHDISNLSAIERLILQIARIGLKESNIMKPELEIKLESDQAVSFFSGKGWTGRFDNVVLEQILEAIYNRVKIEFAYRTFSKNDDEIKLVTPFKIYVRRGQLYLIGFSHTSRDHRTYRLDRISKVSNTLGLDETPYNEQVISDLEKFIAENEEKVRASISLRDGRELSGDIPDSLQLATSDDQVDLTCAIIDSNDLVRYLAGNIQSIRAIAPLEVRQMMTKYLTRGFIDVSH